MKITKKQLRRIIRETINSLPNSENSGEMYAPDPDIFAERIAMFMWQTWQDGVYGTPNERSDEYMDTESATNDLMEELDAQGEIGGWNNPPPEAADGNWSISHDYWEPIQAMALELFQNMNHHTGEL